jgi:hypothetical protein
MEHLIRWADNVCTVDLPASLSASGFQGASRQAGRQAGRTQGFHNHVHHPSVTPSLISFCLL